MVGKSNNDASIGFVLSVYVIRGIDLTAAGEQGFASLPLIQHTNVGASCFPPLSQRPSPVSLFSTYICYPPPSTGAGSLAVL